jgi:hypothetical protein
LILTLPTENATARMRFWRALKAKGCAVLRDGIYLLPFTAERETALRELATAIGESGGTAHLLRAPSLDQQQEAEFRNLFDRSNDYDALIGALSDARKVVFGQAETELRRLMRRLRKDYQSIMAIDFFPTEAATRAEVAWQDFVAHVDTVMSPGEPHSAEREIRTLALKDFQGRTWATRQRIWVDRVASAWLIRRFIDPDSRFIWLTFEVLMASFELESDPALLRLAAMVHALDVGGAPVPEAIGFEVIMAGARERTADDDAFLDEISRVLDSMYTHFTAVAKSADPGGRS